MESTTSLIINPLKLDDEDSVKIGDDTSSPRLLGYKHPSEMFEGKLQKHFFGKILSKKSGFDVGALGLQSNNNSSGV